MYPIQPRLVAIGFIGTCEFIDLGWGAEVEVIDIHEVPAGCKYLVQTRSEPIIIGEAFEVSPELKEEKSISDKFYSTHYYTVGSSTGLSGPMSIDDAKKALGF